MTLVMATLVPESCMVVFGSIIPINEPQKKKTCGGGLILLKKTG